jgi:hypothetical protein
VKTIREWVIYGTPPKMACSLAKCALNCPFPNVKGLGNVMIMSMEQHRKDGTLELVDG